MASSLVYVVKWNRHCRAIVRAHMVNDLGTSKNLWPISE